MKSFERGPSYAIEVSSLTLSGIRQTTGRINYVSIQGG